MKKVMLGRGKGSRLAVLIQTVCKGCGARGQRWLYSTALKNLVEVEPGIYEVPDCEACITWA